ncbi:phage portal protein [Pseudooceanicola marinus]|uniref:phage portal protein n=1 Tax=Pseudooceanicola marinus TaxID=396013 RepID=UPI0012FD3F74|nr:phage portal protein [Pseudooceanicola marinus]
MFRRDRGDAEARSALGATASAVQGPGYEAIMEIIGGSDLSSAVSFEQAMTLPPVFSAVEFLSSTLAALPVRVMQKGAEVKDHPVAALLGKAASDEATAFDLRKLMHGAQFSRGRGYVQIERDARGDPVNLFPMEYLRTSPRRDRRGRLFYDYSRADGQPITYKASEVFDLAFKRKEDWISSVCPVTACASAIRQGTNAAQYALNTFGRNGIPPYVLEGPHGSGEAAQRAADDVASAARQAAEKGRPVMPIPAGFKLTRLGSDPDKMQLVPTQVFTVQQVARIFNLPPVFLQELSKGTYANTEQQDLHLVKHTLTSRAMQAGQEFSLKLFGRDTDLSVEYDLQAMTRGIFRDRIEAIARAIGSGQMTPNEGRALRGEGPREGGDQLFMQSGTLPITSLPGPSGAAPTNQGEGQQ